jgi:hypothetical protein
MTLKKMATTFVSLVVILLSLVTTSTLAVDYYFFLSDTNFDPSTGVTQADSICKTTASHLGFPTSTTGAFITNSSIVLEFNTTGPGNVYGPTGIFIVTVANFTDPYVPLAATLYEAGVCASNDEQYWTGMSYKLITTGADCRAVATSWTSNSASVQGTTGGCDFGGPNWPISGGRKNCDQTDTYPIICAFVGETPPPTFVPTMSPSGSPSRTPSKMPTVSYPTESPTKSPTRSPTRSPTHLPTVSPTAYPTSAVTTATPVPSGASQFYVEIWWLVMFGVELAYIL